MGMTYVAPNMGNMFGEIQYVHPQIGESLIDVGLRFDMGYTEMLKANPGINPNEPLSSTITVLIPSRFIIPNVKRLGIIINLAEFRLYYFPPNDNIIMTMPLGVGRKGWSTPVGTTSVIAKERNPTWRPSVKLRTEGLEKGMLIPNEFPPNEANPLGRQVLRLGWSSYLIHGTNRRDGVGLRISAGCLRMLPEDIEELFNLVSVGTKVQVINEPIKWGFDEENFYVEVHGPIKDKNLEDIIQLGLNQFEHSRLPRHFNKTILRKELHYPSGIPKRIA